MGPQLQWSKYNSKITSIKLIIQRNICYETNQLFCCLRSSLRYHGGGGGTYLTQRVTFDNWEDPMSDSIADPIIEPMTSLMTPLALLSKIVMSGQFRNLAMFFFFTEMIFWRMFGLSWQQSKTFPRLSSTAGKLPTGSGRKKLYKSKIKLK